MAIFYALISFRISVLRLEETFISSQKAQSVKFWMAGIQNDGSAMSFENLFLCSKSKNLIPLSLYLALSGPSEARDISE